MKKSRTSKVSGWDDIDEEDVQLTKEESLACFKAFSMFDKDCSGTLTAQEMHQVLQMLGQNITEEEIYRMFSEADTSNEGELSYTQFKRIISKQKAKINDGSLEADSLDAFVALGGDQDGGGYIDAQKLIEIVKEDFGMTIDIEELIKKVDTDGSGQIEFDEFHELLYSGADKKDEVYLDWTEATRQPKDISEVINKNKSKHFIM